MNLGEYFDVFPSQHCNKIGGLKLVTVAIALTLFNLIENVRAVSGPVAQLGERYTGSVEVVGSIPIGSTIESSGKHCFSWGFFSWSALLSKSRYSPELS